MKERGEDFVAKMTYGRLACLILAYLGVIFVAANPEGLEVDFTRQMTGKTRHLVVFSRHNRVFSRHKQMPSPSGNMIGEATELMMLIPSIASLVASVIMPCLGSFPDVVLTLFSGMGPRGARRASEEFCLWLEKTREVLSRY